MAAAVPSLEDVIAEVVEAVGEAAETWATVLDSDLARESELLDIEKYQERDDSNSAQWGVDLYVVTAEAAPGPAGEAPGENYVIYKVVVTYRNVRSGDAAAWEATAREWVSTVADALDGNADIFRIDGHVQLFTPETASVEKQGFELVEGFKVYKARIVLNVEARRWAT